MGAEGGSNFLHPLLLPETPTSLLCLHNFRVAQVRFSHHPRRFSFLPSSTYRPHQQSPAAASRGRPHPCALSISAAAWARPPAPSFGKPAPRGPQPSRSSDTGHSQISFRPVSVHSQTSSQPLSIPSQALHCPGLHHDCLSSLSK